MRSRLYTKRIEIWQTSNVSDGDGGFTVSETHIANSWCNIKTASNNSRFSSRLTDLGVTDPTNAIIVQLRKRNDINYNAINQYLKYRGYRYIIQNAPTNIDFNDTDIEIIATRESLTSVADVVPIGVNTFDNTFDFTFN